MNEIVDLWCMKGCGENGGELIAFNNSANLFIDWLRDHWQHSILLQNGFSPFAGLLAVFYIPAKRLFPFCRLIGGLLYYCKTAFSLLQAYWRHSIFLQNGFSPFAGLLAVFYIPANRLFPFCRLIGGLLYSCKSAFSLLQAYWRSSICLQNGFFPFAGLLAVFYIPAKRLFPFCRLIGGLLFACKTAFSLLRDHWRSSICLQNGFFPFAGSLAAFYIPANLLFPFCRLIGGFLFACKTAFPLLRDHWQHSILLQTCFFSFYKFIGTTLFLGPDAPRLQINFLI
ncbi:hypothetical protein QA612_04650 [Evansella sp. AB-P1]|uniref:hypothetical protein n=1 Tax=Evansella sp. AB-P1 TaxID=3037653 RepID=UPI00241CC319|nr:hypothetical protein [Evansella sp. AB-P1]MDG5786771.1 hypothetical protein [Evansella sp. AB-P1]